MFLVHACRVQLGYTVFCSRPCVRHSIEERFWQRVRKTDSCWIWIGAKAKGYGVLGKGPKGAGFVLAHRFSWELDRGPIPRGMDVCHNCPGSDRKDCVNPAHLFLGDEQANADDMVAKDGQWNRKLSAAKVRDMRQRHAAGEPVKDLAAAFEVNYVTAWEAVHHYTWKAVK